MTRHWSAPLAVLAVVVALLASTPVAASPSLPQAAVLGTPTVNTDAPAIDVVNQTPWVAPDGVFLLTVEVANSSAASKLGVTLYTDALESRDAFSRSLFGVGLGKRSLKVPTIDLARIPLDASGRKRVTIAIALKQRLAGPAQPGQLGILRGLAGEGAYPVELTLLDQGDEAGARIITHLVRLPDPDERIAPLRAALVLGIHAPPTVSPSGKDTATPATFRSIDALTKALVAQPDVPLTVDPTPETIEAMGRSSDASRATLAELRGSLEGRQILDGPYVDLPLTAWINSGLGDEPLDQQRARGNRVLDKLLTPTPDGGTWLASPDLTNESAAKLWKLGARHLVIPDVALGPEPGAKGDRTTARPFQLSTQPEAPVSAVAADSRLPTAFEPLRQADPQLTAYQVLAELSVIQQEEPKATRGVVLAAPRDWDVSTVFLSTLLAGLTASPLLKPVTLDDLFRDVRPQRGGADNTGPAVVLNLAPMPPPDIGMYPEEYSALRQTVGSYATMVGASDPVLAQFDQRLLLSGSADLTAKERLAYLTEIQDFIVEQVNALAAPVRQTITLTAREGKIPLTLRSRLRRPVKVVLALDSGSRLEFPSDRIELTVKPGVQQVPLSVRTRSPGDIPLTVRVLSPDGVLNLASTQITVRSTAVSGIGYVLSGGAVAFLVLWWLRHWQMARRARRHKHSVPVV